MKTVSILFASVILMLAASCGKPQPTTPTTPPVTQPPVTQPPQPAGTDKALVVGINTYPGAPLSGCVNDAMDFRDVLINVFKMDASNIHVLLDKQATTEAIKNELKWLAIASPGDRRYFHFSGHGTEFDSGNTAGQPDGLNQAICPWDFAWDVNHMVLDVDFVELFKNVPAGTLLNWSSDSCHSGDLTRVLLKPDTSIRQYPMPAARRAKIDKLKQAGVKAPGMGRGVLNVGYVSGCKYDQTSTDAYIGMRHCGAMTHYFIEAIKADPNAVLTGVTAKLNSLLKENAYDQEPQAEGSRVGSPILKP